MAFLSFHEAYLGHDTGVAHPESSKRLEAILAHLDDRAIRDRLKHVTPRPADRFELNLAHSVEHMDRVKRATDRCAPLDPDTMTSAGSWAAATMAAGGALAAADEVMNGGEKRGLCLVRPPGHHATTDHAMGFCLFNNVAVCARYLMLEYRLRRIAIVDFDVHHGNGTDDVFREDPNVFYLSLHRYPFYPGTGGPFPSENEAVAVRNIPLPHGIPREEYHKAFRLGLAELEKFSPQALIVSAGFDAHRDDPIGGLGLETEDFHTLTKKLVALAERTAGGRLISSLEGGYNLETLGPCVEQHLLALDGLA